MATVSTHETITEADRAGVVRILNQGNHYIAERMRLLKPCKSGQQIASAYFDGADLVLCADGDAVRISKPLQVFVSDTHAEFWAEHEGKTKRLLALGPRPKTSEEYQAERHAEHAAEVRSMTDALQPRFAGRTIDHIEIEAELSWLNGLTIHFTDGASTTLHAVEHEDWGGLLEVDGTSRPI